LSSLGPQYRLPISGVFEFDMGKNTHAFHKDTQIEPDWFNTF